jgi:RNA recognition motif-containing protein
VKLYVGNLPYKVSEADLKQAFEAFGEVESAAIIMDRETGRSKGFGFVEMPDASAAQAAIAGMNGKELDGRNLNVSEARPREEGHGAGGRHSGGGRRY